MAVITDSCTFSPTPAVDSRPQWCPIIATIPAGQLTVATHEVLMPWRLDSDVICTGASAQVLELAVVTGTSSVDIEYTPIVKATDLGGTPVVLALGLDLEAYEMQCLDLDTANTTISSPARLIADATEWWGINLEIVTATNAVTSDVQILVNLLLQRVADATYGSGAES